jgi:Protein of unknown function (DUF2845)
VLNFLITSVPRFASRLMTLKAGFQPAAFASCMVVSIVLGGFPLLAHAETLRCNGQIIEVGDSRLSVLYRCGEPLLKDAYCPPVYYGPSVQPVPQPFAGAVPCLVVDEWIYDRGAGNLIATVRFREGSVLSIRYSSRADQN